MDMDHQKDFVLIGNVKFPLNFREIITCKSVKMEYKIVIVRLYSQMPAGLRLLAITVFYTYRQPFGEFAI